MDSSSYSSLGALRSAAASASCTSVVIVVVIHFLFDSSKKMEGNLSPKNTQIFPLCDFATSSCDGAAALKPPPSSPREPPTECKYEPPAPLDPAPALQRRGPRALGYPGPPWDPPDPPDPHPPKATSEKSDQLEELYAASDVALVAKATMEPPMRTEPKAPLGATKLPSTMARPVSHTLTPREIQISKTLQWSSFLFCFV